MDYNWEYPGYRYLASSCLVLNHVNHLVNVNKSRKNPSKVSNKFIGWSDRLFCWESFSPLLFAFEWIFVGRHCEALVKVIFLTVKSGPPRTGTNAVAWGFFLCMLEVPLLSQGQPLGVSCLLFLFVTLPKTNSKSTWKWMVGILFRFLLGFGLFSGANC